jgi:N-acyl-D-amino-acid deacylase
MSSEHTATRFKELGKGSIELALTNDISIVDAREYAMSALLLTESGRPVTWLALLNRDDKPDACQDTLRTTAALG